MHSRCNGSILLGTIAMSVALAAMKPDINVKKPFGCKMCDHFCNQIVGCFSYIYRTIDLSCDPIQAKPPKQKPGRGIYHINATKDKQRINVDNAAECNKGWKMFDNKRGIIKCRPILSSHRIIPTVGEEREVEMKRILIYSGLIIRQLYIDNNSLAEYPFCRDIKIRAVGYISSQRKLVVSSDNPYLFFTSIDNKNKTVIKTKYHIFAIAIDDHKKLVFMKVVRPERCVCVMSTYGKNITSLFSLSLINVGPTNFPGGLIADHKRSLIYVLFLNDKILHFTYEGVSKGKIGDTPGWNYVFCLDMQGYDLYYQVRKNYLHKLSLSDHTVTLMHTLKVPAIDTMLTLVNIIYMAPGLEQHLLLVNMNGNFTTRKINIGYKRPILMCLIP